MKMSATCAASRPLGRMMVGAEVRRKPRGTGNDGSRRNANVAFLPGASLNATQRFPSLSGLQRTSHDHPHSVIHDPKAKYRMSASMIAIEGIADMAGRDQQRRLDPKPDSRQRWLAAVHKMIVQFDFCGGYAIATQAQMCLG